MEYCNISGQIWFDAVDLDYRYRGRDRSMSLPLGYRAAVDAAGKCTDEVRATQDAELDRWNGAVDWSEFGHLDRIGPLRLHPQAVSADLCRYLEGVIPLTDPDGEPAYDEFESLEARAVFRLRDVELSAMLIDGAVLGICPAFADRRDELVALAADVAATTDP